MKSSARFRRTYSYALRVSATQNCLNILVELGRMRAAFFLKRQADGEHCRTTSAKFEAIVGRAVRTMVINMGTVMDRREGTDEPA